MMLRLGLGAALTAAAVALSGCTAGGQTVPTEHSPSPTLPSSTAPATPTVVAVPTPPTTSAPEQGPVAAGATQRVRVTVGDRQRSFLLSVPEGYTNDEPWPAVLGFHGWHEDAGRMREYSGLDAAAALVVYAEGVDGAWSPAPYATTSVDEDLDYVAAVLDWLRGHYLVDDTRIAAAGLSNGGGFATLLGCQKPSEITAVATVSAAYYQDVHRDCADVPVPHLDIHGTADAVIEYYGGTRHQTGYSSVPAVLEAAAERNGCRGQAQIKRESIEVLEYEWTGCQAALEHIRVGGGGHTWPGGLDDSNVAVPEDYATRRILEFFDIGWRGQ